MDEQFVAGIEGFVASDAAGPEAGEVLALPLVDVHFLNVPHQLLLLLIRRTAVDPPARLLVCENTAAVFPMSSCCAYRLLLVLEVELGAVPRAVLVQGVRRGHGGPRLAGQLLLVVLVLKQIIL